MSDPREWWRACAVCGLVLNRAVIGERETWLHLLSGEDDHPAVPVMVDEVRTNFLCDFCLADNARWALPVEDYQVAPGSNNRGDWAACDDCSKALGRNDWRELVERAYRTHRARGGDAPRGFFRELYGQLQLHVTGPVHLYVQDL